MAKVKKYEKGGQNNEKKDPNYHYNQFLKNFEEKNTVTTDAGNKVFKFPDADNPNRKRQQRSRNEKDNTIGNGETL